MGCISAFDIIKVGIGPSSSHTVGPWIASQRFLKSLDHPLEDIEAIKIFLYGSLAKTGLGHGTDIAIMMGLSGEDYTCIDPNTIPFKVDEIKKTKKISLLQKHEIVFDYDQHLLFKTHMSLGFHPNGMRFCAQFKKNKDRSKTYFSIGGGFVVEENEEEKKDTIVCASNYPYRFAQDILNYCSAFNQRLSDFLFLNEQSWRTEEEIRVHALWLWEEMKQCIFRGVNKKGMLPGHLKVKRRAFELSHKLLPEEDFCDMAHLMESIRKGPKDFNTVNKWVSVFALAVNEENAALGRIVTAPTNGSAGVIPAVLMYACCFKPDFTEDDVVRFLITAGAIGALYKHNATISAAMGGCQAEIGVSSSMAAAGLAEILGGTKEQVMQAAEMAMEHHLGMTCDPIGGLVQIPCIERNTMGAMKAITAANIALEEDSFHAKISLDHIIKTMWETALDMHAKYKETSEGGLALVPLNLTEC